MWQSALSAPGPTLKRFQARDKGRAYRILKRTSHITLALAEKRIRQGGNLEWDRKLIPTVCVWASSKLGLPLVRQDKDFGDTLVEDYNLRKYLLKLLEPAGVPKIEI